MEVFPQVTHCLFAAFEILVQVGVPMNTCQHCGTQVPAPAEKLLVGVVGGMEFEFNLNECPVDLIATFCPDCDAQVFCTTPAHRQCPAGAGLVPLDPSDNQSNLCSSLQVERQAVHPRESLRERRQHEPR